MNEITVKQLSEETGLSLSHISHLIKRKVLPPGRKDGRNRYLPVEAKIILEEHQANKDWKQRTRKPKTEQGLAKRLTWADVI